jgi:hypothetical protein
VEILRDFEVALSATTDTIEQALVTLYQNSGASNSPKDDPLLKGYRVELDKVRGWIATGFSGTPPSAAIGRYIRGI